VPNPGTIHGLHTPSYHIYVCATHQKQRTLSEKLNTLEKNTNRLARYLLTRKDDVKHTQKSSHVSRKSKTQRYHNVTHLLVRRKADIRDASQTGNTRNDNSNTHKQPHQLQTNARAEPLLLVHGNNSEYTYSKAYNVTLNSNIRSQFAIKQ